MAIDRELLREIRSTVPVERVLALLGVPTKRSEGYLRFLCPRCGDFHTAIGRENLARCFRCARSFNPIDLVMLERSSSFPDAVRYLERHRSPSAPHRR